MDFLVYDRARHRVWVPAGNTGSVDVIDAATAKVTRIEGWIRWRGPGKGPWVWYFTRGC